MFQRILVPLDGSKRAERVLPLAAQFAHQFDGTVILLRIVHFATAYWPAIAEPYGIPPGVIEDEEALAESYLRTLTADPRLAGVQTKCITAFGVVAPTILEVAKTENADFILICSHGYSGVIRVIMESDADKVARHSTVPTLIFHDRMNEKKPIISSGHIAHPVRVLVPLDGSEYAETAIEAAISLLASYEAMGRKTALHLLHVVQLPHHFGEIKAKAQEHYQEEVQEAKQYLQSVTERLSQGALASWLASGEAAITWSISIHKDVSEAIVRVASGGEESAGIAAFGGCEYIAIATHGHGGLARWAMGSVVEHVLHLSERPVLVVRPLPLSEMVHHLSQQQVPDLAR